MPRTKVKKQAKVVEDKIIDPTCTYENIVSAHEYKMATFKANYENACSKLDMLLKDLRITYKSKLDKTLGELKEMDSDDFEVVKAIMTGNHTSRDTGYLSTETSTDSNYTKSRVQFHSSTLNTTRSAMQTPAMNMITNKQAMEMGFVTPKVKPDRPLTVLRRAQVGEMVISMQGSPVLVNSVDTERPNVNVPLADGRVISVQPQSSIRQSEIPEIDEVTRRQLQTLRDNIDKIVQKKH